MLPENISAALDAAATGARWSSWTVVVRQADRTLPFAQFDPTTTGDGRAQWIDADEYESILSDAVLHRGGGGSDKAVVELWSGVERGLRLHVGEFLLPPPRKRKGEFTGGAFVFSVKPATNDGDDAVTHARYLRVRKGVRGIDRALLMRLNTMLGTLLAMQPATNLLAEARRILSQAMNAKRKYEEFINEHRTA